MFVEGRPETIYVLPAGDALDPRGLAVTLVGRSVMLGASCDRGPLDGAPEEAPVGELPLVGQLPAVGIEPGGR